MRYYSFFKERTMAAILTKAFSSCCPYLLRYNELQDLSLTEDIQEKLLAADTAERKEEPDWENFTQWSISMGYSVNPFLVTLLSRIQTTGDALDLGSGIGDNTSHLLRHKWRVTAVDVCGKAIEALRAIKSNKLEVVHSSIEEYRPTKKFDFILAVNSLGFCTPSKVAMIWNKIYDSLKKEGYILCTLPTTSQHTKWSLTRDEIESLFIHGRFRVIQETTLRDSHASHSLVLILQKV